MNVGGVAVLLENLLSNLDRESFESILVSGICEAPEGEFLGTGKVDYSVERIST
jgi:hypothetical protein